MKIIEGLSNFSPVKDKPLCLILGNFDGVHRGHQQLVNTAIAKSKEKGGIAGAMIFSPHPTQILNPQGAALLLINKKQQSEILEKLGLDMLLYLPFTLELAGYSPEKFVKNILVDIFHVNEVIVGFNYTFGFKGAGKPELLKELGKKYGFSVTIIPPFTYEEEVVSSSKIRNLLVQGNIEVATKMLGYYPQFDGIVIQGEKRGRQIGFPTANIGINPAYVIPGKGVYAAITTVDGKDYPSVVNIGSKPTFHEEFPISIESHIINFTGDIYGKELRLHFLEKIRDEKKFAGVQELITQIGMDRDTAYNICANIKL